MSIMLARLRQEYDITTLPIIVTDNARSPAVSVTATAEQLPALYPCSSAAPSAVRRASQQHYQQPKRSRWISEPSVSSVQPLCRPVRRREEGQLQKGLAVHQLQTTATTTKSTKTTTMTVTPSSRFRNPVPDCKPRMPSRCRELDAKRSPVSVVAEGMPTDVLLHHLEQATACCFT